MRSVHNAVDLLSLLKLPARDSAMTIGDTSSSSITATKLNSFNDFELEEPQSKSSANLVVFSFDRDEAMLHPNRSLFSVSTEYDTDLQNNI